MNCVAKKFKTNEFFDKLFEDQSWFDYTKRIKWKFSRLVVLVWIEISREYNYTCRCFKDTQTL